MSLFAGVKNKNVPVPQFPVHPLGPAQLQQRFNVVPVKDLRSMELCFPILDQTPHYKAQVCRDC